MARKKNFVDYKRKIALNRKKFPVPIEPKPSKELDALSGNFVKVGKHDLLLTKTNNVDRRGNPIYVGTLAERDGPFFKRKVKDATHILVKKV